MPVDAPRWAQPDTEAPSEGAEGSRAHLGGAQPASGSSTGYGAVGFCWVPAAVQRHGVRCPPCLLGKGFAPKHHIWEAGKDL